MCGINCIFDPAQRRSDKQDLVKYMNHQMVYRGPDDQGVYSDDSVALGMRRLSIIDVRSGHQPLYNEDRSLVLVCNGEIYNYVELTHNLKARGHRFMSGSDAETILHLYEEKAEKCLDDLRGMFAFVLWDNKFKRLFAARDRIGIKPLYMAKVDDLLFLSSELKAIVGAARISPTLQPAAVYQFLLYSYAIDQRHTVIEEVSRLLPGEYLIANASGMTFKRYWVPHFGGDEGISDHSDQEILKTMEETVALHLRSDVPVGILLSGGIDSSTVAAFAARRGKNYTALCAGYVGDEAVDERLQAHATAAFLDLPYQDVVLDAQTYEKDFDELVRFCDEPVGDPAAMPQWSLYRKARQSGYKVLLSGIGGDEVFFGYPTWNRIGEQSRSLSQIDHKEWCGFDQESIQVKTMQLLDQIIGSVLKESIRISNDPLYDLRNQAPQGPDGMNAILFGTYLVHNGCQLADKLGMGCSVEIRVPFLDHDLVQTIFDLPLRRRFDNGYSKVLLRRLLRGLLPDAVLNGEKKGFTPPGEFIDRLVGRRKSQILDGVLVNDRWVESASLRKLCSQHMAIPWLRSNRMRNLIGIPKLGWLLFRLLAFEEWYFLLNQIPKPELN